MDIDQVIRRAIFLDLAEPDPPDFTCPCDVRSTARLQTDLRVTHLTTAGHGNIDWSAITPPRSFNSTTCSVALLRKTSSRKNCMVIILTFENRWQNPLLMIQPIWHR